MTDEPPAEWLAELGDRKLAQGEPGVAVHYFSRALQKRPEDPALNLKLAEAYCLLGESGEKTYYALAMEPLRRILRSDPHNEAVNEKLLALAFKTGTLDALTREYGEKAKTGTDAEFYAGYVKRACAMLLLATDLKPAAPGYAPNNLIKFFFDCFILPGGTLTIILSNLSAKYRPFFILGITMFLFYCAYRGIIFMLTRRGR